MSQLPTPAQILNLPDGAIGTGTIESKTDFLRAVRGGAVTATARPLHAGRATNRPPAARTGRARKP
jgi:acyl-coenzyme A thioesterase PaaI-like protein